MRTIEELLVRHDGVVDDLRAAAESLGRHRTGNNQTLARALRWLADDLMDVYIHMDVSLIGRNGKEGA